jgi:hypothetical protein
MAFREFYIGSEGPFLIDEDSPLLTDPKQVALRADLDGIAAPSDSVESETTFGITPSAGVSDDYSRRDHTHGTPDNPVNGSTQNVTVVTSVGPPVVTATLHFTDGLLTSVT